MASEQVTIEVIGKDKFSGIGARVSSQLQALGLSADDASKASQLFSGFVEGMGDELQKAAPKTNRLTDSLKQLGGTLRDNLKETSSFENGLQQMSAGAGKAATVIAGALVGAVTAAGAAIGGAIKSTIDWADKLDTLGDVLGLNEQDAAALSLAFGSVGANADALTVQVSYLMKGLKDERGQLGPTGKALQALGISAMKVTGSYKALVKDVKTGNMVWRTFPKRELKDTATLLDEVARKIAAMPDGAQKTTLLLQLFGKSGRQLQDAMASLASGGLEQARRQAEALGLALTPEQTKGWIQFKNDMSTLGLVLQGIGNSIANSLLPVLKPLWEAVKPFITEQATKVIQFFNDLGVKLKVLSVTMETFKSFGYSDLDAIVQGLKAAFGDDVAQNAKDMGISMQIIASEAGKASGAFDGLVSAIKGVTTAATGDKSFGQIVAGITQSVTQDLRILTDILNKLTLLLKDPTEFFRLALEDMKRQSDEISIAFTNQFFGLSKRLSDEIDRLTKEFLPQISTWMQNAALGVRNAVDEFAKWIEDQWERFKRLGSDIIDGVIAGISKKANEVKEALLNVLPPALRAVLKQMGIASPSKVFYKVGANLMRGLAEGIADSARMPQLALAQATGALMPAGAGVSNNRNINVAISVSSPQDVDSVARRVARLVREA